MTIYAVRYSYVDDPATLDVVRPEHRAYLQGLADDGLLLAAGAFADAPAGAILVYRADSREQVDQFVSADPFWRERLVSDAEVRVWGLGLGPWAADAR